MTRNAKRLLFLLVLALLTLSAVWGVSMFARPLPGAEANEMRYLRAVYVLKSFGGPASAEPDEVPARVRFDDDTESLLHHPDKILVLGLLAEDLAACGRNMPRAGLFEAYARLGMGEKERAASLLMRHVVTNPYNAGHYALLCRTLYEIGDATGLLIICREWAERDAECREDRARYVYIALYALGRFADAEKTMRDEAACLGWQAVPYAAKAALAAGDAARAEAMIEEGARLNPASENGMRRLWERLRGRERL